MELQTRRSFLTRALEFASTIPLAGLIVKNFDTRTSYYAIDSSGAQAIERATQDLEALSTATYALSSQINTLQCAYKQAYHKAHTRMVHCMVGSRKNRHMSMRTETYYTWEEPSNIPNHAVIDQWHDFSSGFFQNITRARKNADIDLNELNKLVVEQRRTGKYREGLVSLAIYAPQIATLLFYEEAIAHARHGSERHNSAEELVDRHDTPQQITRRSLLKGIAAFAAAAVSVPVVRRNLELREQGKAKLENEVASLRGYIGKSEEEVFRTYFGFNTPQLYLQLQNQLALTQETLKTGVKEERVRTAFEDLVTEETRAKRRFSEILGDNVPKPLGDSIKSAVIRESLDKLSDSERNAVYTNIVLTGLAVAAATAGILIPAELVNEAYANRFERSGN